MADVPDSYLEWLRESSHTNFYNLRAEYDRREQQEPLPPAGMTLSFGAYKNQPITAIPDTYLVYLLNQTFSSYHLAKTELTLRSANPDKAVAASVPTQLEPDDSPEAHQWRFFIN